METMYVIIAIALVIMTWVIIRIIKRRSKSHNTIFDQVTKNPTYQLLQEIQNVMGRDATQNGMIPGSHGKFGYDVTNPIPVKGTMGEIAYLAMLRTEKGVKVEYKRIGSTRAANINHPIDIYDIRGDGSIFASCIYALTIKRILQIHHKDLNLLGLNSVLKG